MDLLHCPKVLEVIQTDNVCPFIDLEEKHFVAVTASGLPLYLSCNGGIVQYF